METILTWLFGPEWIVSVGSLAGVKTMYIRAKDEFDAKWKVAYKLCSKNDPQVGYTAFKWMHNLMLEEKEIVHAEKINYDASAVLY